MRENIWLQVMNQILFRAVRPNLVDKHFIISPKIKKKEDHKMRIGVNIFFEDSIMANASGTQLVNAWLLVLILD